MSIQLNRENARRVLLVDDDKSMQDIWDAALKFYGGPYELQWVTNAADAMDQIWEEKNQGCTFDLVICDIFLQGSTNGIDLWKACRKDAKSFLFSSGMPAQELAQRLEREHCRYPFISKPFGPPQCLLALQEALAVAADPLYRPKEDDRPPVPTWS